LIYSAIKDFITEIMPEKTIRTLSYRRNKMKYAHIGRSLLLACITLACITQFTAADPFDSETGYLYQGQAHVSMVYVDSSTQIYLTPPTGTTFHLYARECGATFGCACPSYAYIMQYPTYASRNGFGMQQSLTLPRGTWCTVAFAQSGSGTYTMNQISNQAPRPVQTIAPVIHPVNHGQFRYDTPNHIWINPPVIHPVNQGQFKYDTPNHVWRSPPNLPVHPRQNMHNRPF
jgi:hypothetical protein